MPSADPVINPVLLTFTAKRSRLIKVEDQSRAEVATLKIGGTDLSFRVRLADGSTIRAATKWWDVPKSWRAYGSDGTSRLSVRKRPLENAGLVRLADGTELAVRGVASGKGVDVAASDGTWVLHFLETTSRTGVWTATLILSPSEACPSVMDAVCLVQIWRMLIPKRSSFSDPGHTAAISAAINVTFP
jgi:hypothetical protein